ncbi:MAG TPA: hypothetical protein VNT02_15500 [Burkholderiales bacterium]|nr:hypothetical protein [Burkholderiales bacterium]
MTTPFRAFAIAMLLCLTGRSAADAQPHDDEMTALAQRAGCPLCHEPAPRAFADGSKRYLAPSWEHIATRYREDPRAEEKLTKAVLSGTGRLLTDQHWRGKVFFSEMPNNDVQLSSAEARSLVRWILGRPR